MISLTFTFIYPDRAHKLAAGMTEIMNLDESRIIDVVEECPSVITIYLDANRVSLSELRQWYKYCHIFSTDISDITFSL